MPAIALKPRELDLLKSIVFQPRTAHSLTHSDGVADISLAPHTFRSYLEHLSELGLIEAPKRQDGRYVATDAGREYLENLPQVAPSVLICNASMPSGSYRPARVHVRAGADDHRRFASRGMGA